MFSLMGSVDVDTRAGPGELDTGCEATSHEYPHLETRVLKS